jgi:hypothetical protein
MISTPIAVSGGVSSKRIQLANVVGADVACFRRPTLAKLTTVNLFGFAGYVGESGFLGYTPQIHLMHIIVLSLCQAF